MAITGTHMLFYTPEPEAVRNELRDLFELDHIDSGGGWLIFRLPPAEIGVHPSMSDGDTSHQISFMCDDLDATMAELVEKGVTFLEEPHDEGFGIVTTMQLSGGLTVQLYEPRHETAI